MHTSRVTRDGNSKAETLFDDTDYEKLERLDHAIDGILFKTGQDRPHERGNFQRKENCGLQQ